jgi:hypothetical protein
MIAKQIEAGWEIFYPSNTQLQLTLKFGKIVPISWTFLQ